MKRNVKRIRLIPCKIVPTVTGDDTPRLQFDRIEPEQLAISMISSEFTDGSDKIVLSNMADIVLYSNPKRPEISFLKNEIRVMPHESFMVYYGNQWEGSLSFNEYFTYPNKGQNIHDTIRSYYETLADKVNYWLEGYRTTWMMRYAEEVRKRHG